MQFVATWGLPHLPDLWEHESRVPPRPIYCFPLDEFNRMVTLVAALDALLHARFQRTRGPLDEVIASLASCPMRDLIPWGGTWGAPRPIRGRKAVAQFFRRADGMLPAIEWEPGLLVQPVKSHLPRVFEEDPYCVLKRLNHDQARALTERTLKHLRDATDLVAVGLSVAATRKPASLWTFVLDEWVHLYRRRSANPYCRYTDDDGTLCGALLPLSAPTNREFCKHHQEVAARERKATWAAKPPSPAREEAAAKQRITRPRRRKI